MTGELDLRLNGNGTHHNGNGLANGKAARLGFAPGRPESALSTKSVGELLELFELTGDQAPFEEIVRRYAGMVYNVCYQVSRDSHEAEDATQAVFLTLAVRSKTAQKIQYLGPWLQRVAQRLSLDMKRSKKRRAAREVKHHDLNVSRWEANNGPHDLGMDELRGILRDEIDRLPAKYRMPLILHYFGGLKPEEMSKELGIKANTLGVRLHRARKMLGDNLQKKGIVVGGSMLTAAMATLVPMFIQHSLASKATAAAAAHSLGHSLVAADVTAQVLGAMRVANRAAILGKIKAVTAAIAIGAAAVAGAGQLVRTIQNSGFELRNLLDGGRWLAPLFDRLRSPIKFSDSSKQLDDALNASPSPGDDSFALLPQMDRLTWPTNPVGVGDENGLVLASIGGSGPQTIELRRPPVAAPMVVASPAAPAMLAVTPAAFPRVDYRPVAAGIPPAAPAALAARTAVPAQSVASRFNSAVGAFSMDRGTLDRNSISLDSTTQALRSFHISGGDVRTGTLTVAERGSASLLQTGGRVEAENVVVARDAGSVGAYTLAGGELRGTQQTIGQAGIATFTQTGGENTADAVTLAVENTAVATYDLGGGTLRARGLNVGVGGVGSYNQTGGRASIIGSGDHGGVRIATDHGSHGAVNLAGGSLETDKVFVGLHGDGTYTQRGGQTITNKIVLGTADDSNGKFLAISGTVVLDSIDRDGAVAASLPQSSTIEYARSTAGAFTIAASQLQSNAIVVGLNGDAVFQVGNARASANFTEGTDGSRTPLVVRAVPSAKGEMVGWGNVDLHGQLINNGKLIGDGFGQSRVLDLSSVASVANTIDNDIDGAYGYYARRSGQLRLPAIKVARDGEYNWGESAADPVPDLVNSVRVGFEGVHAPGEARLTLVSPDDVSATTALGAPKDQLFVGLWRFDRVGLVADTTKLLVRYDEQMVEHLGLPETSLALWAYDGTWKELGLAETVLNTDLNLIGGALGSRFEYFAVSVSALAAANSGNVAGGFHVPGLVETNSNAASLAFINDVSLIVPSPLDPVTRGSSPVPEPAAATVIAAALMLTRRRRA